MPPNAKNKDTLNPKECWDAWWEFGTLAEVRRQFAQRGILSNRGKIPSAYGIELAAWRYACTNIDQAKNDFKQDYEKRGIEFSPALELDFYRKMMSQAKKIYVSEASLDRWIAANNLQEYKKYV